MALINYKCGKCGLVAQEFQNQPSCPMATQPVSGGTDAKTGAQQKIVSTAGGHAWSVNSGVTS